MISVFGASGFIGKTFCNTYPEEVIKIEKNSRNPESNNILYFISTTDNYNIFENPFLDIDTNLRVLVEVLENCKNKDIVFNFISSWFVYGDAKLPAEEIAYCNPKGWYSITKRTAEQLLISYCETFDIKYRIFRLSNVIGNSDQGVSKKKNALQFLIGEMKEDKNINLYHGGRFIRDYLHVDDVVNAIHLCLEESPANSITNIGSGVGYEFLSLMKYCRDRLKSKSKFIEIKPTDFHRKIQVKDMYLDTNKLNSYGFKRKYTIWEALDKVCE